MPVVPLNDFGPRARILEVETHIAEASFCKPHHSFRTPINFGRKKKLNNKTSWNRSHSNFIYFLMKQTAWNASEISVQPARS